jgi:hypothetical protein
MYLVPETNLVNNIDPISVMLLSVVKDGKLIPVIEKYMTFTKMET